MNQFNETQMRQFERYVKVQKSNKYNMLTREAQRACSLDRGDMIFIMENYDELAKRAEQEKK